MSIRDAVLLSVAFALGWAVAVLWHWIGHPYDQPPWGPVFEARRRRQPATCTFCGRHAVRWVYASTWRGRITPDDARCTGCGPVQPVSVHIPSVDYGHDITITVGRLEDDIRRAATMLPPPT